MSMNGYELRSNNPEARLACGYWTGAAAAALTKVIGANLTITRTGAGAHTLTWSTPGARLAGLPMWTLAANTPANIAGFTVAFDYDSYVAASRTINFIVYAADNSTATDLATTMGLGLMVPLVMTQVVG